MSDRRARLLEAVKAAREMCEVATPGPWGAYDAWNSADGSANVRRLGGYPGSIEVLSGGDMNGKPDDFQLIVRSRTLLPALLAVAEKQIAKHALVGSVEMCAECRPSKFLSDCPVIASWCSAFGVEE